MEPESHPPSNEARARVDRAHVDAFVRRHFGIVGTLRLHRNAIGWDLLRAPANVALAPVFLLTRLLALILALLRLRRAAGWLAGRTILLRTAVARAVEDAIRTDLLAARGMPEGSLNPVQDRLIEDYTGIRNAISEIFTTLTVLALGFAVFRSATPGIVSLAPILSDYAARSSAVANFPLGQGLGGVWYGMFPVELPVWYVIAVGVALAMVASLVTTFAGVVADPLQAWSGTHRRRLLRLLRKIDAGGAAAGVAGEHLVARMADMTDAVVSIVRVFRP